MTTPNPAKTPATLVTPEPGSRLAELCRLYDDAKTTAEEASNRLEAVKKGIKYELSMAAPGESEIHLHSGDLVSPLKMYAKTSSRFDTKKFAAEQPDVYESYRRPQTVWVLGATS